MEDPEKLKRFFLKNKPADILLSLKENKGDSYASVLARKTDCTYSHSTKILEKIEKMGLVIFEKTGRIKHIKLTESGEDIARDFENLYRAFERVSKNVGKSEVKRVDSTDKTSPEKKEIVKVKEEKK